MSITARELIRRGSAASSRPDVAAAMALGLATCLVGMSPALAQQPTLDGQRPPVIAHRGASGYLPEHTLDAYAKRLASDFKDDPILAYKLFSVLSVDGLFSDVPDMAVMSR